MSRVECPSQAWDRQIAGEDAAAEATMAMEKEILEEVKGTEMFGSLYEEYLKVVGDGPCIEIDPEGIISDLIAAAYNKGHAQASKDRADGQAEYEFEQEQQRVGKEYRVVCFMKIDAEEFEGEPMSYEEAQAEIESQGYMQPEHIFKIEEVENEHNAQRD